MNKLISNLIPLLQQLQVKNHPAGKAPKGTGSFLTRLNNSMQTLQTRVAASGNKVDARLSASPNSKASPIKGFNTYPQALESLRQRLLSNGKSLDKQFLDTQDLPTLSPFMHQCGFSTEEATQLFANLRSKSSGGRVSFGTILREMETIKPPGREIPAEISLEPAAIPHLETQLRQFGFTPQAAASMLDQARDENGSLNLQRFVQQIQKSDLKGVPAENRQELNRFVAILQKTVALATGSAVSGGQTDAPNQVLKMVANSLGESNGGQNLFAGLSAQEMKGLLAEVAQAPNLTAAGRGIADSGIAQRISHIAQTAHQPLAEMGLTQAAPANVGQAIPAILDQLLSAAGIDQGGNNSALVRAIGTGINGPKATVDQIRAVSKGVGSMSAISQQPHHSIAGSGQIATAVSPGTHAAVDQIAAKIIVDPGASDQTTESGGITKVRFMNPHLATAQADNKPASENGIALTQESSRNPLLGKAADLAAPTLNGGVAARDEIEKAVDQVAGRTVVEEAPPETGKTKGDTSRVRIMDPRLAASQTGNRGAGENGNPSTGEQSRNPLMEQTGTGKSGELGATGVNTAATAVSEFEAALRQAPGRVSTPAGNDSEPLPVSPQNVEAVAIKADAKVIPMPAQAAAATAARAAAPATPNTLPAYVLDQVGRQISRSLARNERVVKIQIKPPEMGAVRIEMDMQGNALRLGVVTENSSVKDLLLAHIQELRDSLTEQGIKVEDLDVDFNDNMQRSLADSKSGSQGNGSGFQRRGADGSTDQEEQLEAETQRRSAADRDRLVSLVA